MKQIEVYLQHEWNERLEEDGMFDENDVPSTWQINMTNSLEFVEAINLEHCLSQDDIIDIIDKHSNGTDEDGIAYICYENLISFLSSLLLVEKKVEFSSLINNYASVPSDRIIKFLKMLQRELKHKNETNGYLGPVEEMQTQEI